MKSLEKNILSNDIQKVLSKEKERKYDQNKLNLCFERKSMTKQAKTLNQQEIKKVLDHVSMRKHSLRNRALVQVSFLAGLRANEIASLKYRDVVSEDGKIKDQIHLTADMTKGNDSRTVFISEKLQKELQTYANSFKPRDLSAKFFYSQKRSSSGFNANTICQYFHHLYSRCGIENASSHSGRRTFATQISSNGVGIRVLQKLLGHKNIQTTAIYIYASDDMLRKAVELA
jgi:integrase/recombinase XerD